MQQQKPGKRRWMSRRPPEKTNVPNKVAVGRSESRREKQTMAMAMATAAAAEAVAATAQAAVEMIRLTRPFLLVKEQRAATCIQTAFRGYLGRKALGALKGVVMLQAVVRGHNVRRRAKMTLQCMQSLVRVQTQVCDRRRRRLSCEGRMNHYYQHHWSPDPRSPTMLSTSKEEEDRVSYEELCDKLQGRRHERSIIMRRTSLDQPRDPPPFTRTVKMDTALSCPVHSSRTPPRSIKPISVSPPDDHPTPETPNSLSASYFPRTPRVVPNYMAATVSAKARSQSSPKQQRPSTPDREFSSSAKKRLSFPAVFESHSWEEDAYNI
ncbi:hypothetical protein DM860_015341 [Cuscuta australis]|uniref:DUF4005 domain-containing protein n=1 Tax=Cuscuta australis TaxID=267555 RepID=A0A328DNW6_9ASTE|nr:hypothetical protein DM860_015341 [Cuscuta australis]